MIQSSGKIVFEPTIIGKKQAKQSEWKRTAIIQLDDELDAYYRWFLIKRFSLKLNQPIRGPHITFIADRMPSEPFNEGAKLFDGKEIRFNYDPNIRSNGKWWWLKIDCPDAKSIREAIGLSPDPYFNFHLTIGQANEKHLDFSKYILDNCIRFGL